MAQFETIATDVSEFDLVLSQIKEERKSKQEIISSSISKVTNEEEFLKVANLYATLNKLDLFTFDRSTSVTKMVPNTCSSNKVKFLAYLKHKNSHVAEAQICVYKDTGLGRIEYCGSPLRVNLGYSDLNSTTWFSKLKTIN